MKTIFGDDAWSDYKIKKGEIVIHLRGHDTYELGHGEVVHCPLTAESSWDHDKVEFTLAGYKSVYHYDSEKRKPQREAVIRINSGKGNIKDAEMYAKMINIATTYVKKHKVGKKEVEAKRADDNRLLIIRK